MGDLADTLIGRSLPYTCHASISHRHRRRRRLSFSRRLSNNVVGRERLWRIASFTPDAAVRCGDTRRRSASCGAARHRNAQRIRCERSIRKPKRLTIHVCAQTTHVFAVPCGYFCALRLHTRYTYVTLFRQTKMFCSVDIRATANLIYWPLTTPIPIPSQHKHHSSFPPHCSLPAPIGPTNAARMTF